MFEIDGDHFKIQTSAIFDTNSTLEGNHAQKAHAAGAAHLLSGAARRFKKSLLLAERVQMKQREKEQDKERRTALSSSAQELSASNLEELTHQILLAESV
jgi:hypothetical protein